MTGDSRADVVVQSDLTQLATPGGRDPRAGHPGRRRIGRCPEAWLDLPDTPAASARTVITDVNRDGRADLVIDRPLGATGSQLLGLLSSGSSFTTKSLWSNPGSFRWSASRIAATDVNGDGRGDVVVLYNAGAGGSKLYRFLSVGQQPEVVRFHDRPRPAVAGSRALLTVVWKRHLRRGPMPVLPFESDGQREATNDCARRSSRSSGRSASGSTRSATSTRSTARRRRPRSRPGATTRSSRTAATSRATCRWPRSSCAQLASLDRGRALRALRRRRREQRLLRAPGRRVHGDRRHARTLHARRRTRSAMARRDEVRSRFGGGDL